MIPPDHPRYRSLVIRERLARCAREGVVALEGLAAHGRAEAFDYLIGEKSTATAREAARVAAALVHKARHPVLSVNGNTAALAADECARFQEVTGCGVEVNLFHRSEERIARITRLLEEAGATVLKGAPERLIPLQHDRALCLPNGIGSADLVLGPLEDGDRCEALRAMGRTVVTIDLNPLSRTARTATLTVVDELTRAMPLITEAYREMSPGEADALVQNLDNHYLLQAAIAEIVRELSRALD
ncbi:Phosphopantothenate/pantothenate synthetase [anaerobic digester metagenome]